MTRLVRHLPERRWPGQGPAMTWRVRYSHKTRWPGHGPAMTWNVHLPRHLRHIVDHQLHLARPTPVVRRKPARHMQGHPPFRQQKLAERRRQRAEGNGTKLCTIARLDRAADMIAARAIGIDDAMRRKGEHRRGIAAAIG